LLKNELAGKVAAKLGKKASIMVDIQEGRINPLPYMRARIHILLERSLVWVVLITLKEKKKYPSRVD
jgi:hypothetical protein